MSTIVYHATSEDNAESILSDGLKPGSYVTTSYELAEYYAETVEDEDEDAVVLAFTLTDEDQLRPDFEGLYEPIMTVVRSEFGHQSESDVMDAWNKTDQSGPKCLELIGSAVVIGGVSPERITYADDLEQEEEPAYVPRMR